MNHLLGGLLLLLAIEAAAQPAGAQACANCHGASGEGGLTGAPRLAGLPREYLALQLEGYASGARRHPVMTPIAQALTPAEREALAAYFAGLPAPRPAPQLGQLPFPLAARSVAPWCSSRAISACGSAGLVR